MSVSTKTSRLFLLYAGVADATWYEGGDFPVYEWHEVTDGQTKPIRFASAAEVRCWKVKARLTPDTVLYYPASAILFYHADADLPTAKDLFVEEVARRVNE